MIIRSQDKYSLVNCNHIFMYQNIKLGKAVIASNNNPDLILGLYSTKEKALKVLDMIEAQLDYLNVDLSSSIFHMPQDEKVLKNE